MNRLKIPAHEIELTYVRSSGPGGQNVNKVSSKCQLRWKPASSTAIPNHLRERVLARLQPRLNADGSILISSDLYRDQARNRQACLERLERILLEAMIEPRKRKATRPTRSSERKRVGSKRTHSQKKSLRGRVRTD